MRCERSPRCCSHARAAGSARGPPVRPAAPRPPVRKGPAAADEPPVPAQQRIRADAERAPRRAREDAAERGEQQPVALLEPRPVHLPPQDRQLVTQPEDLQLLRTFAAREQHDQREQPAREDVQKRRDQEQPSTGGDPDATPTAPGQHLRYPKRRPSLCTPRDRSVPPSHPARSRRCSRQHPGTCARGSTTTTGRAGPVRRTAAP
jgi:hypothetical protein